MRYQVQVFGHQVMDLALVQVAVRAIEQEGDELKTPTLRRTITVPDVEGSSAEDWLREVLVGIIEHL